MVARDGGPPRCSPRPRRRRAPGGACCSTPGSCSRRRDPREFTDEAALLEACNIPVHAIPRRTREPQGDAARRPAPGRARRSRPAARRASASATTATRSGPARRPAPRRHRDRRRARASPATRTATSCCTPSPTRCSGAAGLGDLGPAVPGRCADAARGSPARSLLARGRGAAVAAPGWRPRRSTSRSSAPGRGWATRLDAMRDAIAAILGIDAGRASTSRPRPATSPATRAPGAIDLRARRGHAARSARVTIRLQDTLTGEVRPLEPLEPGHVRVYSCGPTVYGPAHIGNFRSFLFADLLRPLPALPRAARDVGHEPHRHRRQDHPRRGRRGHHASTELADRYAAAVPRRRATRSCMTRPDVLPRATEHIPADRGARVRRCSSAATRTATDDGSIFFRIASWPAYGRLARLDPDAMRVGERVEADEYGKDDVRDFALWKGPEARRAVLGHRDRRRAARLAHRVLRDEHGATSARRSTSTPAASTSSSRTTRTRSPSREAATGQPFVRTWLHCAHLQMGGEKMAKSTGNIARVAELVAAGVSPRRAALRPDRGPLPGAAQLLATSRSPPRPPRSSGIDAAAGGARRATARTAPTTPTLPALLDDGARGVRGRRSTTTSTSPRPWPRCSTASASSTAGSTRRTLSTADAERRDGAHPRPRRACSAVAAPDASRRSTRSSRRCSTRGSPPAPRATGPSSDRLRDELLARGVAVEDTRDGSALAPAGGPRWLTGSGPATIARPGPRGPPVAPMAAAALGPVARVRAPPAPATPIPQGEAASGSATRVRTSARLAPGKTVAPRPDRAAIAVHSSAAREGSHPSHGAPAYGQRRDGPPRLRPAPRRPAAPTASAATARRAYGQRRDGPPPAYGQRRDGPPPAYGQRRDGPPPLGARPPAPRLPRFAGPPGVQS